MSQMNPSQARVIDPVLTEVARGYKHPERVGMKLFPEVPVGQRGGKIIQFGKDSFKLYQTGRAPGGNVAVVDYGYSGSSYSLEQHAISGKVPVELLEEAKAVPGIDLSKGAVQQAQDIISLRLEYQQATIARTAGTYASGNKVTLSGSSQWSHADSNPSADIETAREAIRAKTGFYPNITLLSPKAFSALKVHARILDRMKYTGRDSLTTDMLAKLWDIDEVVVGKGVTASDAGVFSDIWGKDVILAYVATGNLASMGTPSYGYTYRLRNYPIAEQGYYAAGSRSWFYPVIDEVSPVIAGAEAGYLITNAVA